jgi:hypothetical protein
VTVPYSYLGFSWVFLSLNLFPIAGVAYMNVFVDEGGLRNLQAKVMRVLQENSDDGELGTLLAREFGGSKKLGAKLDKVQRSSRRKYMLVLWILALAVLAVFVKVQTTLVDKDSCGDQCNIAFSTAAAVLVADAVVLTAQSGAVAQLRAPGSFI